MVHYSTFYGPFLYSTQACWLTKSWASCHTFSYQFCSDDFSAYCIIFWKIHLSVLWSEILAIYWFYTYSSHVLPFNLLTFLPVFIHNKMEAANAKYLTLSEHVNQEFPGNNALPIMENGWGWNKCQRMMQLQSLLYSFLYMSVGCFQGCFQPDSYSHSSTFKALQLKLNDCNYLTVFSDVSNSKVKSNY